MPTGAIRVAPSRSEPRHRCSRCMYFSLSGTPNVLDPLVPLVRHQPWQGCTILNTQGFHSAVDDRQSHVFTGDDYCREIAIAQLCAFLSPVWRTKGDRKSTRLN